MPMTKPPIAELQEKVDCNYTLVVETAKRARALVAGAQPLFETQETKPIVIAIDEIHRGLIGYTRNLEDIIEKDELIANSSETGAEADAESDTDI